MLANSKKIAIFVLVKSQNKSFLQILRPLFLIKISSIKIQ